MKEKEMYKKYIEIIFKSLSIERKRNQKIIAKGPKTKFNFIDIIYCAIFMICAFTAVNLFLNFVIWLLN